MSHAPDVPFFVSCRRISTELIKQFADIVNDHNPIHLDDEAAKAAGFDKAIAHGMLVSSYISGALTEFYGKGTIYVKQDLKFIKPVYVDTLVHIRFLNEHLNTKGRLELETRVYSYHYQSEPKEILHIVGHAEVIPGQKEEKCQSESA